MLALVQGGRTRRMRALYLLSDYIDNITENGYYTFNTPLLTKTPPSIVDNLTGNLGEDAVKKYGYNTTNFTNQ